MLDLAVAPSARPLLKHVRSRREFETLRDLLRNPFYRRDVYVRGAAVGDEATFWAQHDQLVVGLVRDLDRVDFGGHAIDFRGFPFDSLRDGPRRVADISGLVPGIARNAVRSMSPWPSPTRCRWHRR